MQTYAGSNRKRRYNSYEFLALLYLVLINYHKKIRFVRNTVPSINNAEIYIILWRPAIKPTCNEGCYIVRSFPNELPNENVS